MYIKFKHSNLSVFKQKQLLDEFVYLTPARVCAHKLHLNKNTVNLWYDRLRHLLMSLPPPTPFSGIVEVDESYFGQKRFGITGTGTADKVPLFGLRERKSGLVGAEVVNGTDHTYLIPLIEKYVQKKSTIYSDGFGAYYHLPQFGYKHYVVLHAHTYVTSRVVHTNGIESFWSFARHLFYLKKGLLRKAYPLQLKEAVERFNTRDPRKLRRRLRKLLRNTS